MIDTVEVPEVELPSGAKVPEVAQRRKRRRRLWRPRLSLRDLFWLSMLAAICMTWYRDHQQLRSEIMMLSAPPNQSWSVDQLLGPPNTPLPGDRGTAWASSTQDSRPEWLIVEFARQSDLAQVEVVETYNPGAICRICAVNASGVETELWKGSDPAPPGAALWRSKFPVPTGTRTRRVKIYLDSPKVPGWNEIDAVALHDRDGSIQWATNSWASSAYGDNRESPRWFWP